MSQETTNSKSLSGGALASISILSPVLGLFASFPICALVSTFLQPGASDSLHGFTGLFLSLEVIMYFSLIGCIAGLSALSKSSYILGTIGIVINLPLFLLLMSHA